MRPIREIIVTASWKVFFLYVEKSLALQKKKKESCESCFFIFRDMYKHLLSSLQVQVYPRTNTELVHPSSSFPYRTFAFGNCYEFLRKSLSKPSAPTRPFRCSIQNPFDSLSASLPQPKGYRNL